MSNHPNEWSFLLVDDDQAFGLIVEKEARNMQLDFQSVDSLKKLKSIKKNLGKFDAFFVDYDLEDSTGFEVAEFLEKNSQEKPIIMVSSTNRPFQDKLGELSNIAGFVSKWTESRVFVEKSLEVFQTRPGIKIEK